ncbi:hypothetical protein [Ferrovibrio sp.]|uniref:hypothetical protein n=1 Tax=Ferrovibrio sp. TaxID=1917215 RepID=UPI003D0E5F37
MRKTPYTSQSYIEGILGHLEEMQYSIYIEPDLRDWVNFLQHQPKTIGINATFNPRHHELPPGDDNYWLRVMQGDTPVACIAYRLFDLPGGWISFLRSGRLWSQYIPPLAYPRVVHPNSRDYTGRIGHHGGLWVNPEHRGRHLNFYLTRLVRARSLQYFNVDHHCGVVFEGLKNNGLPLRPDGYGYERLDASMEGFLQTVGQNSRLFTTYISRAGMLKQIAAGPHVPSLTKQASVAA